MNKTDNLAKFIEEYQCSGCVCGSDISCYEKSESGLECKKHVAGTTLYPVVGRIFLGMPKGFCRLGSHDDLKIEIFAKREDRFDYDFLNVPVWKYLDMHENTLVRGIHPRVNYPFLHIFLENCMDKIDCYQITENDLEGMD